MSAYLFNGIELKEPVGTNNWTGFALMP